MKIEEITDTVISNVNVKTGSCTDVALSLLGFQFVLPVFILCFLSAVDTAESPRSFLVAESRGSCSCSAWKQDALIQNLKGWKNGWHTHYFVEKCLILKPGLKQSENTASEILSAHEVGVANMLDNCLLSNRKKHDHAIGSNIHSF